MARMACAVSLCLGLVGFTWLAYGEDVPRLMFAQFVDSLKANLARFHDL